MKEMNIKLWITTAVCAAITEMIVVAWFSYGLGRVDAKCDGAELANKALHNFQDQAVALGYAEFATKYNGWHGDSGFHWIKPTKETP